MDMTWKWKLNDKRTQDRYVEKGLLEKTKVEGLMKTLPDESSNATWVEIDMEDLNLNQDALSHVSSSDDDSSEGMS